MAKIKEAEVRRQLLSILPDYFEFEGSGKVKVRIYQIDKLADYFLNAYNVGWYAGKKQAITQFKKAMNKL